MNTPGYSQVLLDLKKRAPSFLGELGFLGEIAYVK